MDHESQEEKHDDPSPEDVPPGVDPDPGFYSRALARMPRWIAFVTAAALPFAWWHGGPLWAASFLSGAIGGYWNYVGICGIVDRLTQTVQEGGNVRRSATGSKLRSFLRLLFFAAAAFVIIRFTHINLAAAFLGLFTPVAAVVLEILYELTNHG
jgi:hypothetical protein